MLNQSYFLWPAITPIYQRNSKACWEEAAELTEKIEAQIAAFYSDYYPVLFPSGRSAIYSILEAMDARRNDYVAISPFSSHCVIEAIGRLAVPTEFSDIAKSALVYHQWGYKKTIKNPLLKKECVIVEDSCDSLVQNKDELFPNQGVYEVFSLPKLLGTTFGGVVICKAKNDALQLKQIRSLRDREQSYLQYKLKNRALRDKTKKICYEYWEGCEAINGYLPLPAVRQIEEYIRTWPSIIEQRQTRIMQLLQAELPLLVDFKTNNMDRLPVVVPVALHDSQLERLTNAGFQPYIRSYNVSEYVDEPRYVPSFPLPIHQQVFQQDFEQMLHILQQ